MKLPKELTLKLLEESPAMRSFVVELLYGDEMREIVARTINTASGKIDAIKKVRELAEKNPIEFSTAFPKYPLIEYSEKKTIGLADAKRLVESLRDFD